MRTIYINKNNYYFLFSLNSIMDGWDSLDSSRSRVSVDFALDKEFKIYTTQITNLTNERDDLEKELRAKQHEFELKINELHIENEKINKTKDSLEEFVNSLKNPSKANQNIEKDKMIFEKEKLYSELESKYLLVEQDSQDVKRQNQKLNVEISNLKFVIEKLHLNAGKSESSTKIKTNEDDVGISLEEAKLLLSELMTENDDLKKEKTLVEEKALQILTDKELENLELKEKLEQLTGEHRNEVNALLNEATDYREKIIELEGGDTQWQEGDDKESLNSEEENEFRRRRQEESDKYYKLKQEFDESLSKWEDEKDRLERGMEHMESDYKATIEVLEEQLGRLKLEKNNMEVDREELQREITHDTQENIDIKNEIDLLHDKVRNLEDQKEKLEQTNKEKIKGIKSVISDFEKQNFAMKDKCDKFEKEVKDLKENKEKRAKDLEELKAKLSQKEKENASHKNKIDSWEKEKNYLKKDHDEVKKNFERLKLEYKEVVEKTNFIKEHHENELKRCDDTIISLEKKLESEKNQVIILSERLRNVKKGLLRSQGSIESNEGLGEVSSHDRGSLSTAWQSVEKEIKLEDKVNQLRDEITQLNNKLSEATNKNKMKTNAEIEVLRKENTSLFKNIKDTQELYEKQIKDLQKKNVSVNSEYQNFRRVSSISNLKGNTETISKYLQVISDLENKIKGLKAEIKFLNEKIELLNKDIETQKSLRGKDNSFLKEELKKSDDLAVDAKVKLAGILYDKEEQIIQLKQTNKRYKTKIKALQQELTNQLMNPEESLNQGIKQEINK